MNIFMGNSIYKAYKECDSLCVYTVQDIRLTTLPIPYHIFESIFEKPKRLFLSYCTFIRS